MKNYYLDRTPEEARDHFRELIVESNNTKYRRFDNWFRLRCEWTKKVRSGCEKAAAKCVMF